MILNVSEKYEEGFEFLVKEFKDPVFEFGEPGFVKNVLEDPNAFLEAAVRTWDPQAVETLFKWGADISQVQPTYLEYPEEDTKPLALLSQAVANKSPKIVEILIESNDNFLIEVS